MANTSATGGYLAEGSAPLSITALENAFHDVIAGITELSPKLVRPSRQIEPAKQPKPGTDWAAFEIVRDSSDINAHVQHVSTADGHDLVIDHDVYVLAIAFYGPNSDTVCGKMRRGLYVWQNREALRRAGIAVQLVGNPITMPELDSSVWRTRTDLDVRFVVEIKGRYAVLNLLRSTGDINSDDGTAVTFDTEEVKS